MTHSYHMIPPNKAERAAGPMRDPLCGCVSWRSNPRSVWMRETPTKHGGKSGILGVGRTQYMHIPILSMVHGFLSFFVLCIVTAIIIVINSSSNSNQSIMSVQYVLIFIFWGLYLNLLSTEDLSNSSTWSTCGVNIASFLERPFETFDPDGKSSARF